MSTSDLVVGLLCIYCAWIVHELCSGLALIRSFLFWKFWLRKRTGCFGSTGQSHWSLSISPRGLEARFLFLMRTHTCIWTPKASHTQRHMYSVPGPVSHSRGTVPPDSGNTFVKPPLSSTHTHRHTHTLTHPSPASDWWSRKSKNPHSHSFIRLRASVWPGWLITLPQGGRRTLAAFRSLTIPSSHLHMDTHKHWDTHGQIFRPHQQHHHRHLPDPWVEDMWPGEMRHAIGLALTDLLLACLPENYQLGTVHRNREGVCFLLWLQHSPSALLSSWILLRVALARVWFQNSEHSSTSWICILSLCDSLLSITSFTFPRI